MHAVIAAANMNWDPDTWEGDIWDEDDDRWGEVIEEEIPDVKDGEARPIVRRKAEKEGTNPPRVTEITEDYSQREITDLLSRFSQRSGEPAISWLVRLSDGGAGGVWLDPKDCLKFLSLTSIF